MDKGLGTVEISEVPDEAMSPIQPRTTASADLPHLSFLERKPKKLGAEYKCVADGRHGLMRRPGAPCGPGR